MNGAVLIIVVFQQNIDLIAYRSLDVTFLVPEFRHRNLPFGLIADVHHDKVIVDLDNPSPDYLSFLDILKALIVKILHSIEIFQICFEQPIIGLRWLS